MSNWDDELFEELERENTDLAADAENRQREEWRLRNYAQLCFDEILKITQDEIYRLDSKRYGNRRELNLGYINYTITGDHFLINLANLRMHVKLHLESSEIGYDIKAYNGDINRPAYFDIPEHSGILKVRIVNGEFGIFQDSQCLTTEEASRILLREIITALNEQRRKRQLGY